MEIIPSGDPVQKKEEVMFIHLPSVKLDDSNHVLWKQQITAAIRGHDLEKYLEADASPPAKFASPEDQENGQISQEYLAWQRQDQLLVAWMLSSMSEEVLTRTLGCETSAQIWEGIQTHYASQTRAKIKLLKTQLKNTKKGRSSCNEYLLKIKAIIDILAALGSLVSTNDHIEYIFEGLPEDYDPFVTAILTRLDPYTVADIESLLLAQEARIEKNIKVAGASVNLARTQNSGRDTNKRAGGRRRRTPGRRGRGRVGQKGLSSAMICQICNKPGHSAAGCWYRFDQNFSNMSLDDSGSRSGWKHQNTASQATSETVADPAWYVDSGASSHISHHGQNLVHKTPYTGQEQVNTGDGSGLTIKNTGYSYSEKYSAPTIYNQEPSKCFQVL